MKSGYTPFDQTCSKEVDEDAGKQKVFKNPLTKNGWSKNLQKKTQNNTCCVRFFRSVLFDHQALSDIFVVSHHNMGFP